MILITPKTEQEYSLVMELLKKMRIKATPFHDDPVTRMTLEQYREMAEQSLSDAEEGRTISQVEMEKRVASWR